MCLRVLNVGGDMTRMRYQVGFVQQGRPEPEVSVPSLVSPKSPQGPSLASERQGEGSKQPRHHQQAVITNV